MNRLREVLARRIEDNGGYTRRYYDRYALSWTVDLLPDLSLEHIHKLTGDARPVPDEIAADWDENELWSRAQEDAARCLDENCAYRSYSVPAATKWGFAYHSPMGPVAERYKRRTVGCAFYPAVVAGWIRVRPYNVPEFEVGFCLEGRGGKHVCVTDFEGVDLRQSSDDLAEAIRAGDAGTNLWCRKLLAMMDVWDEALTSEAAEGEAEYQAASRLEMQMDEHYSEAAEVQFWAERDVITA